MGCTWIYVFVGRLRYKENQEKVMAEMEFMCTKREARKLTLAKIAEAFAPMARSYLRKQAQLERRATHIGKYKELCDQLAQTEDPVEIDRLCTELEQCEANIQDESKPLAFAEKMDQWDWKKVASYTDEWTSIKDSRGKVIGGFSFFWLCKGNNSWESKVCNTVLASQTWKRKHEDVLASGQRHYCLCCGCAYKWTWGGLCEITSQYKKHYVLVDTPPPEDHADALHMHVEEVYGEGCLDPRDLLTKLPVTFPDTSTGLFAPATQGMMYEKGTSPKGVFRIQEMAKLESLPRWKWDQVWNFFKQGEGGETGSAASAAASGR